MDEPQTRSLLAAVAAGALTCVPVCATAWTAWQVIEGGQNTLLTSQFRQWALVTLTTALVLSVAVIAVWRKRAARLGAVTGLVVACAAVGAGLLAEIADSGGFA